MMSKSSQGVETYLKNLESLVWKEVPRQTVEFLDYWKQDDYEGMAKLIPPSEGVLNQKEQDIIKEFCQNYELKHFVLQSVDIITPVLATAIAEVNVSKHRSEVKERIRVGRVR